VDREAADLEAVPDVLLEGGRHAVLGDLRDKLTPALALGVGIVFDGEAGERVVARPELPERVLAGAVGRGVEVEQAVRDGYPAARDPERFAVDLGVGVGPRLCLQLLEDVLPVVDRSERLPGGVTERALALGFPHACLGIPRPQLAVVPADDDVDVVGALRELPHVGGGLAIGEVGERLRGGLVLVDGKAGERDHGVRREFVDDVAPGAWPGVA